LANICQWLEEAGYRNQIVTQSESNQSIPVNAKVHIENINIDNISNQIQIGVLLQLAVPLPSETFKKD